MIKIKIICVGNLKEKYFREACLEYSKRLTPFCKFEIIEVSEHRSYKVPSQMEVLNILEKEADKILSKVSNNANVVSLCIEGEAKSSQALSLYIKEAMVNGISEIIFIIGGSYGLSDKVKGRSNLKLSMSKMTFPHQLARVMLAEQIYRAFEILNNTKYHK